MHNDPKDKIRIKKHGLHNKYKSQNKLSMQRTLQRAHETWICIKITFLELLKKFTSFSCPIKDKLEKACELN